MMAWRFFGAAGGEVGASERFADRDAAEAWVGTAWPELRERGVEEVELFDPDSGVAVYRMGLAGPEE
jgi:hypothetical protein